MTDTLFADVSHYQRPVSDAYPYRFFSFRSNDGEVLDRHCAENLAWAKRAADAGTIAGFIVYFVWERNWQQAVALHRQAVGSPHPKMATMIDCESWNGQITGNQSAGLNAAREQCISWLGGNRKRVIGYANVGDQRALWPSYGDTRFVIASYGSNPAHPAKLAHQFACDYHTAPFGACDINSADGLNPAGLAAALGLGGSSAPSPRPWPSYMRAGNYFGLISGPDNSHGGFHLVERADVRAIQHQLQTLGYAHPPVGWAAGVFEQSTADAVTAFQHERMPGTQFYGQVWPDDWAVLFSRAGAAQAAREPQSSSGRR